MSNIPIFLSSDDNYAPLIATTIASICDNTKSFCEFYILDGGISEENKERIAKLKNKFNNFSMEYLYVNKKLFDNFVANSYVTIPAYYRFIIPKLKPNLNKVIYLDVDIIACQDIKNLYNEDLGNSIIGAVEDHGNKNYINRLKYNTDISLNHTYFNSGVLLIDCQKWRESNVTDQLFEAYNKYRRYLLCNDQDILNKVFENNYKILEEKYNSIACNEETCIRHYYAKPKPWEIHPNIKNCENLLKDKDIFWKYAKSTEFYDYFITKNIIKTQHNYQFAVLYNNKIEAKQPKISVIIPVYNTEKYLRKCIDSVINQTLQGIEVIAINDNSTDSSLDILKEYENKRKISIIDLKENKGAAFARNAGIDIAHGEFLSFIDSDDYMSEDFLEKLYMKAKVEQADCVKGNYAIDNKIIDSYINTRIAEDKNGFCFSYCSAIFKTNIIKNNNICFPMLIDMEDPCFSLQFAQKANKVVIQENAIINIVRRNDSQTAQMPSLKRIEDRLIGLGKMIDILNVSEIKSANYVYVASFWIIGVFLNSERNTDKKIRTILADGLIKIFKKTKYKDEIIADMAKRSKNFAFCFKNKDVVRLANISKLCFDKEYIISELRKNIKQKNSNINE